MARSLTAKDEYEVVEVGGLWGVLSVVAFLYSLPLPFLATYLPGHPYHFGPRPAYVLLGTFGFSFIGIVTAWIGRRLRRDSMVCRWALVLNGAVAGILIAAALALTIWWRLSR